MCTAPRDTGLRVIQPRGFLSLARLVRDRRVVFPSLTRFTSSIRLNSFQLERTPGPALRTTGLVDSRRANSNAAAARAALLSR